MGNLLGLESGSEIYELKSTIIMEENPSFHNRKEKIGRECEEEGDRDKAAVRGSEDVCVTDVLQDLLNSPEFRGDVKWQLL